MAREIREVDTVGKKKHILLDGLGDLMMWVELGRLL
jgi:hypothetical protein